MLVTSSLSFLSWLASFLAWLPNCVAAWRVGAANFERTLRGRAATKFDSKSEVEKQQQQQQEDAGS